MAHRAANILLLQLLLLSTVAAAAVAAGRRVIDPPAAAASASCNQSVNALVSNCQAYVMGMWPPLPSNPGPCCNAIQSAPLDCVCNYHLPSYLANVVNQQAVKDVVRTCGVQVPAGTTCGGVQWGN